VAVRDAVGGLFFHLSKDVPYDLGWVIGCLWGAGDLCLSVFVLAGIDVGVVMESMGLQEWWMLQVEHGMRVCCWLRAYSFVETPVSIIKPSTLPQHPFQLL
jgi:hypothetical protein